MPLVCVGFVLTERICTGRRLSWATARLVCFFSFCIEIFIQFTGKKILLLRSLYGQQDMICLATNISVKKNPSILPFAYVFFRCIFYRPLQYSLKWPRPFNHFSFIFKFDVLITLNYFLALNLV